jgi:hypothetical protein
MVNLLQLGSMKGQRGQIMAAMGQFILVQAGHSG